MNEFETKVIEALSKLAGAFERIDKRMAEDREIAFRKARAGANIPPMQPKPAVKVDDLRAEYPRRKDGKLEPMSKRTFDNHCAGLNITQVDGCVSDQEATALRASFEAARSRPNALREAKKNRKRSRY